MTCFPPIVSRLLPRLATEHIGELVATRDAIVRSLRAVGLDLHDLAAACSEPSLSTAASYTRATSTSYSPSFGDMARGCRDFDRGRLTPRERSFVAEMCGKGFAFSPTPRQAAWLGDILDRLQGRAAA